jgi:hypothetical protein
MLLTAAREGSPINLSPSFLPAAGLAAFGFDLPDHVFEF